MGRGVEISRGKLRISFQYRGERCRETLDLKATAPNIKHAERLRAEIVSCIKFGTFNYATYFPKSKRAKLTDKENPSFKRCAEDWFKTLGEVATSTKKSYRTALESFWYPAIGSKSIADIKRSDILKAISDKKWKSLKTRNNYMIPMRAVFEFVYLDGLITSLPTTKIKNAKFQTREPDPFTLEEIDIIIDKLRERYGDQAANYFEFAFFTGLRTSELIALWWKDMDTRKGYCRVHRAFVAGEMKADTKTHQWRDVELNARALSALNRQKQYTLLSGATVFNNPVTGKPWLDDKSQRENYWQHALKALGIRYREAYQTRHTFATLNLMAGANPMWVARQMGHKNMKMILERYARWIPDADKGRELEKVYTMIANR